MQLSFLAQQLPFEFGDGVEAFRGLAALAFGLDRGAQFAHSG